MPDLTVFIPPEIFGEILSHLNQVDCIECMTVCRRWYKLIPQCGEVLWEELEISNKSWSRPNIALLECLGTHVKKVSISPYQNLNKVLKQFERQECNIQSLNFKDRSKDYPFDLDSAKLFTGIGLFGRTLKELSIIGTCTRYFSLTLLLNILPALTHLTVKFNYLHSHMRPQYDESINNASRESNHSSNDNNSNYKLVYLCLDSEFRYGFQIKPLLQRCPRLKFLVVSNFSIYTHLRVLPADFTRTLEICPSIRYIHWGEDTNAISTEKEWFALSKRSDLTNNNNDEERKPNHLRQVEFYSENEEQHISTLTASLREPSLLEHIYLSSSFLVDLYDVWNNVIQHNSHLLSQPSQLKSLELVGFSVLLQTEDHIFFEDFFNYFQNIERLKMDFFVAPVRSLEDERNYMRKFVEAIGHQLQQLRYLYLDFACCDSRDTKIFICDNLCTTLCDSNQNLEILHLSNVSISNEMLLEICCHPKLHTLNLVGYQLHKHLTKDGLISFARKLKEQEQNNGGRLTSLLLSCGYSDDVTDEVIEELASVKSLKTLRIACSKTITDEGVNKFATIKSNSIKIHKKIELYSCKRVSLDNPYVVFVHSHFS